MTSMADAIASTAAERSVRICSPNIVVPEDFEVRLPAHTTIATLKEQLAAHSAVCYDNADGMRLIYQGRILEDSETLATTLKHPEEQQQTFHLVAKRSSILVTNSSTATTSSSSRHDSLGVRSHTASAASASTTTTTTTTTTATMNGAESVPVAQDLPAAEEKSMVELVSITRQYSYYQVQLGQQAYMLQVSNTLPFQAHSVTSDTIAALLTAAPLAALTESPSTPIRLLPPTPLLPPAFVAAAPVTPPAVPEPPVAAAAAVPLLDPEQLQRLRQRYLADFWLLVKLSFFVYLFTQRSGLWQTSMIYLAAMFIFLYQSNRIPALHAAWQRLRHRVVGTPLPAEAATEPNMMMDADDERTPLLPPPAATEAAEAVSVQPISMWRSVEHALTTFFTSLLPGNAGHLDPALNNADEGVGAHDLIVM